MNKQLFRLGLITLLGVSVLTSSFYVSAQNSSDLKAIEGPYANHPEIKDLNQKIEQKRNELQNLKAASQSYQQKLTEASKQSKTLASQLQFLDNQSTKMELDIKTTEAGIDQAKLQIESLKFQIDKEQAEIDSRKETLRDYLKLINKEDQRGMLELLLLHNSFSEFFNQLSYISDIQSDLKKTVDRLNLLKDSLTAQMADMQNYQKNLEKLSADLSDQQDRLKEQYSVKEDLLLETKRSEVKYSNLISQESLIESDVKDSINSISSSIKNKISQLRSGGTTPKTTLQIWPVDPSRGISAFFHDPDYPFRYLFEHPAIDIRTPQGTPIKAPADGYVAKAKDAGYGYSYVTIIHDNGISTVYGHVSKIFVSNDQFVKAGEVIALSGATPGTKGAGPFTTGPHLHFEVRLSGIPVDPLQYLP